MSRPPSNTYVGRFAPSPTGPIHIGTLVSAMASYLDARINNGKWLLRIEDVDRPREVSGSAESIIRFLDCAGFGWDDDIIYQSQRNDYYQHILQKLQEKDLTYPCECSRKQIANGIYRSICRDKQLSTRQPLAIRIKTDDKELVFNDRIKGQRSHRLLSQTGDFVIKRKDGLFAYQLAVVADDADCKVTDVVRGADLLDSTPRQIYLYRQLGMPEPSYAHTTLILDHNGNKFSKSQPGDKILKPQLDTLVTAWNLLQPEILSTKDFDSLDSFWAWAGSHWDIKHIKQDQIL